MVINKHNALNLMDALNEWFEVVAPKELEENEIGLDSERYEDIMFKLNLIAENNKPNEYVQLEFDFGIMETIDQSLNMRQA
jgi:hypothetical protein